MNCQFDSQMLIITRAAQLACVCFGFFALAAIAIANVHADEPTQELAWLGKQPITQAEVDFQLGRRRKKASGEAIKLPTLSQANLQSTIYLIAQQRQALQTLRSKKQASTREDVETWLLEHAQPPDGTKLKVADIVRLQTTQAEISESTFREHIAFRLSWQRYLATQLTEKNIGKHFENDRKRFNGTRYRLSSVAIPVPAGDSNRRTKMTEALQRMVTELNADVPKWSDAVKAIDPLSVVRTDYWVRGTGDVDPTVITTLIKLKVDEVSQPIQTPTSVQLVKLLEVEEGDKELSEVHDDVRAHLLIFLIDHLASQSREQLPLKSNEG